MTTYVLGAGASRHAGYPLCSELWSAMAMWVIELQPQNAEYRQAIETVALLHGPVTDTERVFTDLDQREGAFHAFTGDQRDRLKGAVRRCLRDYFKALADR
jgi:hypothetical protein